MTLLLALFAAAQISPACTGGQLAGTFAYMPNSAGAGNVVYTLTVRNTSPHHCFVSGIPGMTLLDRRGSALPTHVIPVNRGALTAVRVDLAPGKRTSATARFSPDVPGPGEPVTGACETTAYWLSVKPNGGGTLRAAIKPPTPVCEHGGMTWTVFTAPAR